MVVGQCFQKYWLYSCKYSDLIRNQKYKSYKTTNVLFISYDLTHKYGLNEIITFQAQSIYLMTSDIGVVCLYSVEKFIRVTFSRMLLILTTAIDVLAV